MVSQSLTVCNPLGMHARAAARFVHTAGGFVSHIRVACERRVMDGKSIMGLLLLAATRGAVITITADGPDERLAIDALVALVERGFGDDTCTG